MELFQFGLSCNIAEILFLKCDVTKFRIPHPCLTMSHFVDPPPRPLKWDVIYGCPLNTTSLKCYLPSTDASIQLETWRVDHKSGLMIFHLCLPTIGTEASSWFVGLGAQWTVEPRDDISDNRYFITYVPGFLRSEEWEWQGYFCCLSCIPLCCPLWWSQEQNLSRVDTVCISLPLAPNAAVAPSSPSLCPQHWGQKHIE